MCPASFAVAWVRSRMETDSASTDTLLQRLTQQSDGVLTVAFVTSILSSLGALFIIVNWVLIRSSRIFFLKLIVFLSIANLLSSASYIMAYIDAQVTVRGADCDTSSGDGLVVDCPPDMGCLVQAMLMLIFENASVFWTVAIAYTLHEQVGRTLHARDPLPPNPLPRCLLPAACCLLLATARTPPVTHARTLPGGLETPARRTTRALLPRLLLGRLARNRRSAAVSASACVSVELGMERVAACSSRRSGSTCAPEPLGVCSTKSR